MNGCAKCGNRRTRLASVNGERLCKDCRRGTLTRTLRRRLRVIGPKRWIVDSDRLDLKKLAHQ